jgi:hypothetical protein
MDDMTILRDFLELPLADSNTVFERFVGIPGAIRRGNAPKQFLFIEGSRENKVLLVAHADTYANHWNYEGTCDKKVSCVDGVFRNEYGALLGADDRAGCAIVYLLRDLGHSILITDGEEIGQRGSNWLTESQLKTEEKQ